MSDDRPARRALLSVSDKSGIVDLSRGLADRGWELLSTGGTARTLREAGLEVTDVAEVTGHPEMMNGRVKTLHPAVHAGLLVRRGHEGDAADMAEQGYRAIDLVAVNLYPFRETVAQPRVTLDEALSKIDIGGPTMIRAAAKNHSGVWVAVDPSDYRALLAAIDEEGEAPDPEHPLRLRLAAKVFEHVNGYDRAVADFLGARVAAGAAPEEGAESGLPPTLRLEVAKVQDLRYGENPDQQAAFYRSGAGGITGLEKRHGKALSYNNLLDLDGVTLSLAPFALSPRPAVCIVKHTTPCGLAVGETLEEAYRKALACDPTSAFGSVIAVNRKVDASTAEALSELFVECLVAPGFDEAAFEILTRKKNVRLLEMPGGGGRPSAADPDRWERLGPDARAAAAFLANWGREGMGLQLRSIYGGLLAQTPAEPPFYGVENPDWSVATEREPDAEEWDDLRFAWAAAAGVKSNAILLARGGATVGIGAGQMSRVDASKIAVRKAGDAGLDLTGSVLASDAFFPFRDGVDAAAEAGVRAIVQPGGSIRDDEVVEAANEHGIAMVFTGRRTFRH